jgi:hypothetical protein
MFGPKKVKVIGGWRRLTVKSLMTCTFHQILLHDQTKENEMSKTCSMAGKDEKCI